MKTKYVFAFLSFVSENRFKLWLVLSNLRSFIKRQMRDTSSDNEWYIQWQRVTTNDNEWYNKWQRMTMSGYFGQFSFFFERIRLKGILRRTFYTLRNTLKRTYWIKSRFSHPISLEEILTVRSKYWDRFFCL